jgi:hypothetical protein
MKHSAVIRPRGATTYRDQALSTLEGIEAQAWDGLNADCPACNEARSLWCDRCADLQARGDEVQPLLRKPYDAEDDDAARAIVSETSWRAVATDGIGRAAA